jgi:prepilin-type processing-associated H-X9-DG protein
MPFIEEQAVHDLPKDGKGDGAPTTQQMDGALKMIFQPGPATFYCPSRRAPAVAYLIESHHAIFAKNATAIPVTAAMGFFVGTNDYAGNAGDDLAGSLTDHPGPPVWQAGVKGSAGWDLFTSGMNAIGFQQSGATKRWLFNGVIFQVSEVGPKHILDGLSSTYLCGERYVRANNYKRDQVSQLDPTKSSVDGSDSWTWSTGACRDTLRSGRELPLQDNDIVRGGSYFGAAHPGTFHMAFCDGHVEGVSYEIDLLVHQNYSNRRDSGRTVVNQDITP